MTFDPELQRFADTVAKAYEGIRVVQVLSVDGSIIRFLVAPADKFKDELLPAQKARQEQAGAMPPEIYGHDLFELLKGNVVRLRDGSRLSWADDRELRLLLLRFLDQNSYHGQQLVMLIDRIREGQAAARKANSTHAFANR